jgi:hypothetical protein
VQQYGGQIKRRLPQSEDEQAGGRSTTPRCKKNSQMGKKEQKKTKFNSLAEEGIVPMGPSAPSPE